MRLIKRFNFFKPVILVRLYGGLGNQLFTYSAAFRLAKYNDCELFIDTKSGFIRDYKYQRKFSLNSFSISARAIKIPYFFYYILSFFIPFFNKINRKIPFHKRVFIVQDRISFNESLLYLNISSPKLFEGYWQSEKYFKDIEKNIRDEFRFNWKVENCVKKVVEQIDLSCSIAIHLRDFSFNSGIIQSNIEDDYYFRAIGYFKEKLPNAKYFLFSDNPNIFINKIYLNQLNVCTVSSTFALADEIEELCFMSKFKYFIIANSTFSWWGAWLSDYKDKIVVAPKNQTVTGETAWGFDGLLPDDWKKM